MRINFLFESLQKYYLDFYELMKENKRILSYTWIIVEEEKKNDFDWNQVSRNLEYTIIRLIMLNFILNY